jgi:hypothetical protein
MSDVRYGCPRCGSEELRSFDVVPVASRIVGWTEIHGELVPDFDGKAEVFWDGQRAADPAFPYECVACLEAGRMEVFAVPKRLDGPVDAVEGQ